MSLIIFCLLPIHSVDFALRSSAKVRGTQRQWCSDHGRSETARDPSGSQIGIPASARRRASSWSPAFGIWSLCLGGAATRAGNHHSRDYGRDR
jgi:hypothetical protein